MSNILTALRAFELPRVSNSRQKQDGEIDGRRPEANLGKQVEDGSAKGEEREVPEHRKHSELEIWSLACRQSFCEVQPRTDELNGSL